MDLGKMKMVALGVFSHCYRMKDVYKAGDRAIYKGIVRVNNMLKLKYHIDGDLYRAGGAEDNSRCKIIQYCLEVRKDQDAKLYYTYTTIGGRCYCDCAKCNRSLGGLRSLYEVFKFNNENSRKKVVYLGKRLSFKSYTDINKEHFRKKRKPPSCNSEMPAQLAHVLHADQVLNPLQNKCFKCKYVGNPSRGLCDYTWKNDKDKHRHLRLCHPECEEATQFKQKRKEQLKQAQIRYWSHEDNRSNYNAKMREKYKDANGGEVREYCHELTTAQLNAIKLSVAEMNDNTQNDTSY